MGDSVRYGALTVMDWSRHIDMAEAATKLGAAALPCSTQVENAAGLSVTLGLAGFIFLSTPGMLIGVALGAVSGYYIPPHC